MDIKILKLFVIFVFTSILLSCNAQNNKELGIDEYYYFGNDSIKIPDFFNKKYFHGYQLSPDDNFPIYTHVDSIIGDISVNYILKDEKKQTEWFEYDSKNNIFSEDEPDAKYFSDLNNLIKSKLEPELSQYYVIAEYTPREYIAYANKKAMDYIYPYYKYFYLYDNTIKKWHFLTKKIVNAPNENITTLQELNNIINNNQNLDTNKFNFWAGKYVFYYDIFRREEYHTFDLFINIDSSYNAKLNFEIDDTKSDTLVKGFIDNNKFIIRYYKDGQKHEYILKKDDNGNYFISGSSIYLLNPPNDNLDIEKTK